MTEKSQDRYIGRLLDNRYEILSIIGEGGMAVVYKALCHRLNRYVAIKIMRDEMADDEEFRRKFCAESQAVAMLSHPNIVSVYDVSHSDEVEYIVMELIDGITLKQYLDKKGSFSWKEVLFFSRQMAKAISHAHSRGIIHRDIKPQNIMLLKDGTIKIADFGIAALENEIMEYGTQTFGSIHYMSPEQARGELQNAKSDIYSLGIVIYEMLTGKLPYEGDTAGEIAVKHLNSNPELPHLIDPEIPLELERITLKCMNADASSRYSSADELLEDLDKFALSVGKSDAGSTPESEQTEEEPVTPVRSSSELSHDKFVIRRRRSKRVSFLSGSFLGIILFIALFVFFWNFWLGDVFSPAVRVTIPDFTGSLFDSVANNPDYYSKYNFKAVTVNDTTTQKGTILSQEPESGRSIMLTDEGIDMVVYISSGAITVEIPPLSNLDYREAMSLLQQLGLSYEIENQISSEFESGAVIYSTPSVGSFVTVGSTIYLTVSSGNEISYVTMPNLIGNTEDTAITKINNSGLCYGGCQRVNSDVETGTVIEQSVEAFTEVQERTKIYLKISN